MKQLVDFTETIFDALGYFEKFYGLVKTTTRSAEEDTLERYPAEIGFEEIPIEFETKMSYMRVGQITDVQIEDEACGKRVTRTFPFTVVVALPNDILSTPDAFTATRIAQNISNSVQDTQTKSLRLAIKADNVDVDITNIITDPYEVWTTERNDPYAYPTDRILISFQMSFVIDGHISCFQILGCDDDETSLQQEYVDSDELTKFADFGSKIICTPAKLLTAYTCAEMNDVDDGLTQAQRDVIQRRLGLRTGQTISYAADDDGDLELGFGTAQFTLDCDNTFGNTNRITDVVGTQAYATAYAIDHATGLAWHLTSITAHTSWADALTVVIPGLFPLLGFSDWRMPNDIEIGSILSGAETTFWLDYAPFNFSNNFFYTSSTNPATTSECAILNNNINVTPTQYKFQSNNKLFGGGTVEVLICRTHF